MKENKTTAQVLRTAHDFSRHIMNGEDPSPVERRVKDAMLLLDRDLTHAYYRAVEIIPHIVRRETKIVDFLHVENNDPKRAAIRLARYWNARKELFLDRWQLPMTQTGTGCLSPFDITILRSGYMKLAHSDTHGTVLIIDFTLLPPGVVGSATKYRYLPVTWLLGPPVEAGAVVRYSLRSLKNTTRKAEVKTFCLRVMTW